MCSTKDSQSKMRLPKKLVAFLSYNNYHHSHKNQKEYDERNAKSPVDLVTKDK